MSDELIKNDLESNVEEICDILFNAVISWCRHADPDNAAAVLSASREMIRNWTPRLEAVAVSRQPRLRDIHLKLAQVRLALAHPASKSQRIVFKFHIPSQVADGAKLAESWTCIWRRVFQQNLLTL